ncbi:unnamed protein product [Rotaria sp. Silwood2]|nr:unnamed protein product [Rotaria sp. Silwood2]CAF3108514.1 unnamed protein product [Rotaria sp. Silwood2]CAF3323338.1 unnamed protein product [Rotaria sp. Silwood2]CAF3421566.1 unnamed protein product [Rotaria sp. Silwood2]CAF4279877.1 unnamed protein product [Rotaria sp. Silwood2]
MHKTIAILSLLIFVATIDGKPQRSSSLIKTDAKELAELMEKLWAESSNDEKNLLKQTCQVVKKCCPPTAISKVVSSSKSNIFNDPASQIATICLNTSDHADIAKKCPSALKLKPSSSSSSSPFDKLGNNIDLETLAIASRIMKDQSTMDDFVNHLHNACNTAEQYALLCMSNKKLLQSCIGKHIQKKFVPGNKTAYETYVKIVKMMLTDITLLMKKANQSSTKKT